MSKRKFRRYFSATRLAIVIVMVLVGLSSDALKANWPKFKLYWLLVLVLLLWVVALVFIDVLMIRQDFVSSKRSIFRDTIGDPELLKKLRDARTQNKNHSGEKKE